MRNLHDTIALGRRDYQAIIHCTKYRARPKLRVGEERRFRRCVRRNEGIDSVRLVYRSSDPECGRSRTMKPGFLANRPDEDDFMPKLRRLNIPKREQQRSNTRAIIQ